jgi:hypothetical protein
MVPLLYIRVSQAALVDRNPHIFLQTSWIILLNVEILSLTDNVKLNPRYPQTVSSVEVHFEVNII